MGQTALLRTVGRAVRSLRTGLLDRITIARTPQALPAYVETDEAEELSGPERRADVVHRDTHGRLIR